MLIYLKQSRINTTMSYHDWWELLMIQINPDLYRGPQPWRLYLFYILLWHSSQSIQVEPTHMLERHSAPLGLIHPAEPTAASRKSKMWLPNAPWHSNTTDGRSHVFRPKKLARRPLTSANPRAFPRAVSGGSGGGAWGGGISPQTSGHDPLTLEPVIGRTDSVLATVNHKGLMKSSRVCGDLRPAPFFL